MPAHDQGVGSFNCAVGTDLQGPVMQPGDTTLNYLGSNVTAGSGAATLIIYDGAAANNKVVATLGAPTNQSVGDTVPTFIAIRDPVGMHYTMSGTGGSAQIRWNTG